MSSIEKLQIHQQSRISDCRIIQGLLVVPGIWRTLQNFSSGSVCLALASHHFDEEDYVRDYDEFLKLKSIYNEE